MPFICSFLQILLPMEADGWGGQMEASLSVGDWITNVAYFSVVSICAPIWEEVSLLLFPDLCLASIAVCPDPSLL